MRITIISLLVILSHPTMVGGFWLGGISPPDMAAMAAEQQMGHGTIRGAADAAIMAESTADNTFNYGATGESLANEGGFVTMGTPDTFAPVGNADSLAPMDTFAPGGGDGELDSDYPSIVPSFTPSVSPSIMPSATPSALPSTSPSQAPSDSPSLSPSDAPSIMPSNAPSDAPSFLPSSSDA